MASPVRDSDITLLLRQWNNDDPSSKEQVIAAILPELKRIARARMRHERPDHTLQPTALISELYVYLMSRQKITWESRAHFLAVCSEAMRRILVDYARAHSAQKRGGTLHIADLNGVDIGGENNLLDVLVFDELLNQLAERDARMAKIVELRFFGGLTNAEIAEVIGFHERTVKRDWEVARAWLYSQIRKGRQSDDAGLGAS